jgi:uncharacterized UBP type Zn finger protein
MKKCVYCKNMISDENAIDVCQRCGVGVWGQRMFDAIVKSMDDARHSGNLVSTNMNPQSTSDLEDE